jgi:hypothetical protein
VPSAPQLRQLNVTYVEAEDRLLLKVSTSDNREYRAWCTRRYTSLLLERLESLFESEVDEQQVVPEAARKEVARMKHGSEVSEASFQKPYEAEPESFPLGEEGILLTALRYNQLESGVLTVNLSDGEGRGMTLNLDRKLRHQLYELFRRASGRAGWFEPGGLSVTPVVH